MRFFLILGAFLSLAARADLMSNFGNKMNVEPAPAPTASPAVCADFNGKWEGTCTSSSGSSITTSFDFSQEGCEYVVDRNTRMPIGGRFATETQTPARATSDASVTATEVVLYWADATQGELRGTFSYSYVALTGATAPTSATGALTMKLDAAGQLIATSKSLWGTTSSETTCTMTKK